MRITIVGGGIVGLTSAVALLADGHRVMIVDDDQDRSAASWGNAGHIATEQTAPLASAAAIRSAWRRRFANGGALDLPAAQVRHWLPFLPHFLRSGMPGRFASGQAALATLLAQALPAWHDLAHAIGEPALVRDDGHFVVWESARSATAGTKAWQAAQTGTATCRPVTSSEHAAIAALTTTPVAGAIRFAGSGRITDLGQLATALERAILAAGGSIVPGRADLAMVGGQAAVSGHEGDCVLVAAGARSGPLMARAGHHAPLVAERGYHIRAAAPRWHADMPPVVFEDRSMIVTRFADTVQAASFVEYTAVDTPPDPRKWDRLEAHVRALGLPLQPPSPAGSAHGRRSPTICRQSAGRAGFPTCSTPSATSIWD